MHVLYPLNTLKQASPELYYKAKGGDVIAAIELLTEHLDVIDKITESAEIFGSNEPILAPVLAIEALGNNRLPLIFAELIRVVFDFEIAEDLVQTVKANHTNAGAYERIVRQPRFDGHIEAGREYIIIDDTVAMGGTLAALKGYIESQGGKVIHAITLTGLQTKFDIVPTEKMLRSVLTKHPNLSEWWRDEFGFPVEYLTQGELGHLRTPSTLDEIRDRLIAAGFQSSYEASAQEY